MPGGRFIDYCHHVHPRCRCSILRGQRPICPAEDSRRDKSIMSLTAVPLTFTTAAPLLHAPRSVAKPQKAGGENSLPSQVA
ncbi:hypothetical protein LX36DRAFT_347305 [Colletotrichum falcatum]|nr:hypothetical protein LX36DRAFT_347305 [Colletotrichum falcatum]